MAKKETVEFDGPPYEPAPSPGVDPDHAAYVAERAEANLAAAQAKVEVAQAQVEQGQAAVEEAQAQVEEAQALVEEAKTNSSAPGPDETEANPQLAVSGSDSPSVGG